MTPTTVILDKLVALLGADPTTIAPAAAACHVHLAKQAFTPSPTLLVSGLTEATFDGSTAKNAGIGAQEVFVNPVSGLRCIQLLEPAGGWHWAVTGTTDLPQTIYGWYVTDNTDAVLYASELFAVPILVNTVGQAIDLAWARFSFLAGSPV